MKAILKLSLLLCLWAPLQVQSQEVFTSHELDLAIPHNDIFYPPSQVSKPLAQRLDLLFSVMGNQFLGTPAQHLGLGAGMKVDITFSNKKALIYGLTMNLYTNKLEKEYPIVTTQPLLETPLTALVGATLGRWFGKFGAQVEAGFSVQNITEKQGDPDPDWVQLDGWGIGFVFNYPIQLGRDHGIDYYGEPTLFKHQLNLHLGIRSLFLSLEEATGAMVELGVGYRLTGQPAIGRR